MNKFIGIFIVFILFTTLSFAADFSPTVMTLTCSDEIEYEFDGSDLSIPFKVDGTSAAVWLVINTKGEADNIVDIRNGHLGWHYVNKIDTTVYISNRYSKDPGETSIVWDGRDIDDNPVSAGTYDYYLWAYDDKTPRQLACDFIMINQSWDSKFTYVYENDEDGLPLTKPLLMGANLWWAGWELADADVYNPDAENQPWREHGIHFKWELGSDPNDVSLLQTTLCAMYKPLREYGLAGWEDWDFSYGGPVFDPHDYSTFYHCSVDIQEQNSTMYKWTFISDGEAELDEDWFGWDELTWRDGGAKIDMWTNKPSCHTDGEYILINPHSSGQRDIEWNKLRCVSFEGDEIFNKMMHDWYLPDDPNPRAFINGRFRHMGSPGLHLWGLSGSGVCMQQLINTSRLYQDTDDDTDMVVWENRNGDYFLDAAYYPDVEPQWYCLADSKTESMTRNGMVFDKNGFAIVGTSWHGLVSFVLLTQDGTGVADCSFADDSVADDLNIKLGGQIVDYGSNFDGLYRGAAITPTMIPIGANGAVNQRTTNFIAFDSANGIITNEPGSIAVENEAQAVFAVDQNAPNPFNPTTSISFAIPADGHVTIVVYNVAGQKVDTLANDFMNAGKHSIVFDATGFSNGVYFYTVKSGDFSKTMKMTLLK